MSSRKWLDCRLQDIRERLVAQEHGVSLPVISRLLKHHSYDLKGNPETLEGPQEPARDQQLQHIHAERTEPSGTWATVYQRGCQEKRAHW